MRQNARTQGANARAPRWDEFEEQAAGERTGSWLPLDSLDEEVYIAGPQLRAMPATPGRTSAQPMPGWAQKVAAQPVRVPLPAIRERARGAEAQSRGVPLRGVAMLAAAALTALAIYVAVSAALEWVQVKVDDFQYGRPRTMQLDAFVGHNEAEGVPTHFIAMNLNRRVTVIELPGGENSQAHTIVGPYLFGQGEDLTPVQAAVQDVNGDDHPDLLVSVKSEQIIYLNDGQSFKLMSPEERAALQKSLEAPVAEGAGPMQVEEGGK